MSLIDTVNFGSDTFDTPGLILTTQLIRGRPNDNLRYDVLFSLCDSEY